jgi:hypothetical protein
MEQYHVHSPLSAPSKSNVPIPVLKLGCCLSYFWPCFQLLLASGRISHSLPLLITACCSLFREGFSWANRLTQELVVVEGVMVLALPCCACQGAMDSVVYLHLARQSLYLTL